MDYHGTELETEQRWQDWQVSSGDRHAVLRIDGDGGSVTKRLAGSDAMTTKMTTYQVS